MAAWAPNGTGPLIEPRSPHTSDSSIQPFLQADFDPADYLNSTLPSLSASARNAPKAHSHSVPLHELGTQLQALLSQLNAQSARLSNALNQLTDEIIRSGNRLSYEVEVLHGEATGLTDVFENGLKQDIELFASTGTAAQDEAPAATEGAEASNVAALAPSRPPEPEYLEKLTALTAVRSRLDSVVRVFGDAMTWPIAPSELSGVASSLISVSAPASDADMKDREEKGKEYAEKLREEIYDLIRPGNDPASLDAALARIEELRQLVGVWKGTAEEKARAKFIESLQKPVEERQKAAEKSGQASRKPPALPSRGVDLRYGDIGTRAVSDGGYGFLQNLRNLRHDLYVD